MEKARNNVHDHPKNSRKRKFFLIDFQALPLKVMSTNTHLEYGMPNRRHRNISYNTSGNIFYYCTSFEQSVSYDLKYNVMKQMHIGIGNLPIYLNCFEFNEDSRILQNCKIYFIASNTFLIIQTYSKQFITSSHET